MKSSVFLHLHRDFSPICSAALRCRVSMMIIQPPSRTSMHVYICSRDVRTFKFKSHFTFTAVCAPHCRVTRLLLYVITLLVVAHTQSAHKHDRGEIFDNKKKFAVRGS